nr:hypothetical protein [Tanacetum cinerariifolium]
DGFEQIMDFLNAHPIRYALTINPTIYVSCVKQFWSTVMAKTINGKVQLHAKVDGKKIIVTESSVRRDLRPADEEDGKKIIVTESSVRRDLRPADEEGIDCLPNSIIFEQLALMGIGKGFSGRVTPLFSIMVIQNQSELGEGLAMPTDPHHTPTILQPSTSQPQKIQKHRKPKRKNTQVPQPSGSTDNVADDVVHKELGDSLVRAATTASSLEADQDSGNINKTQSKATPNEPSSQGTDSGGGLRSQEAMRDTTAQTRFESVFKHFNDSLLARGNILQSDEDRLKLNELMA